MTSPVSYLSRTPGGAKVISAYTATGTISNFPSVTIDPALYSYLEISILAQADTGATGATLVLEVNGSILGNVQRSFSYGTTGGQDVYADPGSVGTGTLLQSAIGNSWSSWTLQTIRVGVVDTHKPYFCIGGYSDGTYGLSGAVYDRVWSGNYVGSVANTSPLTLIRAKLLDASHSLVTGSNQTVIGVLK